MSNEPVDKSLRPKKKDDREPEYMKEYSVEDKEKLTDHLLNIPAKSLSISERFFLWGKDSMPSIVVPSRASKTLRNMIIGKRIGQETIDVLKQEKVAAIHNPTDHIIRVDMPRESGCSTLIAPPGGYFPITAYGDEFLGNAGLSDLRKVDYDPDNQSMNPPSNQGVGPTLDRRKTDPEFAAQVANAAQDESEQIAKDRPEIVRALHAAMSKG